MRKLLVALALVTGCAYPQDRAAAPVLVWKDQAEFEIADRVVKESDPAKALADLDEWTAKYPDTANSEVRKALYATIRRKLDPSQPEPSTSPCFPVQKVEPQYSDEARLAGLEGSVLVSGVISNSGAPQDVRVSRPLGLGLDEQALAAASQLRFEPGPPEAGQFAVPIEFALPSKQSRWHLVGVEFKPPEGATRPTFAKADYPLGSGISLAAYEEARLLSAIGRAASATVTFDIDERGTPGHFAVTGASADVWAPEAVMVVQSWRFHPGMKAGLPVTVPCTLQLIWGPVDFNDSAVANQFGILHPTAEAQPPPRSEPLPGSAIVSLTEPNYTEEARQAGVEGTVWISLTVDEQGTPVSVRVDGPMLGMGLEASALEAIKQWRFQPKLLNGQPINVSLTAEVHFQRSGVESAIFLAPPRAVATPAKPKR